MKGSLESLYGESPSMHLLGRDYKNNNRENENYNFNACGNDNIHSSNDNSTQYPRKRRMQYLAITIETIYKLFHNTVASRSVQGTWDNH